MKNVHYPLVLIRRQIDSTLPNSSVLQDKSEIILLIILGNCLMIDSRWVVRKGVDVEWCVVSIWKRKVFLFRKVEGDI